MNDTMLSVRNRSQGFKPLKPFHIATLSAAAAAFFTIGTSHATPLFKWTTVVNNADLAPKADSASEEPAHYFYSYNQPSINDAGLVVFRARAMENHGDNETDHTPETITSLESGGSHGGGGGSHSGESGTTSGIFTRDMGTDNAPINKVAVRGDAIPSPNNITTPGPSTFNEFPSFPRIDATSSTFAFRGQSKPSWNVTLPNGDETRSGNAGLYYSFGDGLNTGIRNIEAEGGFHEYLVPGTTDTRLEQFPGAPSPTGDLIAFKGNWTDSEGKSMTGVFYRDITGNSQAVKIAQRGDAIPADAVPGTITGNKEFDSTAPPSAAAGKVVFTGLDNEKAPTAGGIFMADLAPSSTLKTIAGFNTSVPTYSPETKLNGFGEGLSFDGRYVGFWAGWGEKDRQVTNTCTSEGCKDLLEYCTTNDTSGVPGDGQYTEMVHSKQGIFLADTKTEELFLVAETGIAVGDDGDIIEDFLFWNYSGKTPGKGGDHESEGETGEGPRWRSSAYLAIDGDDVFFKALLDNGESGIFGAKDITTDLFSYDDIFPLLTTGMDGGLLDPMADGLSIVSLGIERDGFRNGRLAITASMTDGDASWAGVYITHTPEPTTLLLFGTGLAGIAAAARRKR